MTWYSCRRPFERKESALSYRDEWVCPVDIIFKSLSFCSYVLRIVRMRLESTAEGGEAYPSVQCQQINALDRFLGNTHCYCAAWLVRVAW